MGCGCKSKKALTGEEQAAAKSAQAESRSQAVQRFRAERQQRLMAQQRHLKDAATQVLEESLNVL